MAEYGINLVDIYDFNETGFLIASGRRRKAWKSKMSAAWKSGIGYSDSSE